MKIISHRGNVNGIDVELENNPDHVLDLLKQGMEVEIDVWGDGKEYHLGHDQGVYKVNSRFLRDYRLWCHAKNPHALEMMAKDGNIHFFWHQNDLFTVTSRGYIWNHCNTNLILSKKAVCVLPELNKNLKIPKNCMAVCTDFVNEW